MKLAVELLSITYVLVLVYLVLTHAGGTIGLIGAASHAYNGGVKVLQGR